MRAAANVKVHPRQVVAIPIGATSPRTASRYHFAVRASVGGGVDAQAIGNGGLPGSAGARRACAPSIGEATLDEWMDLHTGRSCGRCVRRRGCVWLVCLESRLHVPRSNFRSADRFHLLGNCSAGCEFHLIGAVSYRRCQDFKDETHVLFVMVMAGSCGEGTALKQETLGKRRYSDEQRLAY